MMAFVKNEQTEMAQLAWIKYRRIIGNNCDGLQFFLATAVKADLFSIEGKSGCQSNAPLLQQINSGHHRQCPQPCLMDCHCRRKGLTCPSRQHYHASTTLGQP